MVYNQLYIIKLRGKKAFSMLHNISILQLDTLYLPSLEREDAFQGRVWGFKTRLAGCELSYWNPSQSLGCPTHPNEAV